MLNFNSLEEGATSLGELAGGALPIPFGSQIGRFAGGLVGKAGGLFVGHGKQGHEAGDIGKIAVATGLSDAQVGAVCADEESRSPDNYDDIVKKYANNIGAFGSALSRYNQAHSFAPILPAPAVADYVSPPASVIDPLPLLTSQAFSSSPLLTQPVPLSTSARYSLFSGGGGSPGSSSLNSVLADLLRGAAGGAQKGATDVLLQTPAGREAQNQGAKQWLKDNVLYIFAGVVPLVVFITWLAGKAFKK
jgi:hypothetical protein